MGTKFVDRLGDVLASFPRKQTIVVRLALRSGLKEGFPNRVDVFADGQHIGCLAKSDVTPQILQACPVETVISIVPQFSNLEDIAASYEHFYIVNNIVNK